MEESNTGGIPTHRWTDVIADIAVDRFLDAVEENRRLVETGLYTKSEFQELCDFTHTFWCDYDSRFLWCRRHNMIEYRGRSQWSRWWYDSPVDHILTVYGTNDVNVKGYKDGKHVLEMHFNNLNTWDDYKREVTDKYHLLDNDPDFLGRRDTSAGLNWIGDGSGLIGPVSKWVLEDEPAVELASNPMCYSVRGYCPTLERRDA